MYVATRGTFQGLSMDLFPSDDLNVDLLPPASLGQASSGNASALLRLTSVNDF